MLKKKNIVLTGLYFFIVALAQQAEAKDLLCPPLPVLESTGQACECRLANYSKKVIKEVVITMYDALGVNSITDIGTVEPGSLSLNVQEERSQGDVCGCVISGKGLGLEARGSLSTIPFLGGGAMASVPCT